MTVIIQLFWAIWLTDESVVTVCWPVALCLTQPPRLGTTAMPQTLSISAVLAGILLLLKLVSFLYRPIALPVTSTSSLRCAVKTLNISHYWITTSNKINPKAIYHYWWEDKRETKYCQWSESRSGLENMIYMTWGAGDRGVLNMKNLLMM